MRETSSTQKVCSFYVSNMHFATMILPFVNRQMEGKNKIITFFENNIITNIELVLSKLITTEERKKELLNINWKNTKVDKHSNIEKHLKTNLCKKAKHIIIVNGEEEYITAVNNYIERYIEKNHKKLELNNIKVMNFYEVREL